MDIKKFNEEPIKDRIFTEHGKILHQRVITYNNSLGYKLYYLLNFNLIEIEKAVFHRDGRNSWGKNWGEFIFFMNEKEYNEANDFNMKCKELYDQHILAAKKVTELPLSNIYEKVLKIDGNE